MQRLGPLPLMGTAGPWAEEGMDIGEACSKKSKGSFSQHMTSIYPAPFPLRVSRQSSANIPPRECWELKAKLLASCIVSALQCANRSFGHTFLSNKIRTP